MKIGILGDIHEDVDSLQIALNIFEKNKCDKLICLGDILGFEPVFYQRVKSRDASACIALIRSNCEHIVVGNHDLFAIKKLPKNKNGFQYPDNWYELSIEEKRKLSNNKIWLYENEFLERDLSNDEIDFIDNLPEYKLFETDSKVIHISHSIFPDLCGSNFFRLHNPWELKTHFDRLKDLNVSYSFSGHMHSKYLHLATYNKIWKIHYGKQSINLPTVQFIVPCVAKGKGKSGIVIADFSNNEFEAIQINKSFERSIFSIYGKKG